MKKKKILAKYTIDEVPPSNNRFIGRLNRWDYQAEKKRWAKMIWLKCRPKPVKPLDKVEVKITYFFKTKIRHDPDNFSGKFILDGLTGAGILKDDSFDNIILELEGRYDKINPRTEIEITGGTYE